MKKKLQILIFLIISSCTSGTTEIKYYPTDELEPDQHVVIIDLDSTNLNFRGITNLIGKVELSNSDNFYCSMKYSSPASLDSSTAM